MSNSLLCLHIEGLGYVTGFPKGQAPVGARTPRNIRSPKRGSPSGRGYHINGVKLGLNRYYGWHDEGRYWLGTVVVAAFERATTPGTGAVPQTHTTSSFLSMPGWI